MSLSGAHFQNALMPLLALEQNHKKYISYYDGALIFCDVICNSLDFVARPKLYTAGPPIASHDAFA